LKKILPSIRRSGVSGPELPFASSRNCLYVHFLSLSEFKASIQELSDSHYAFETRL